MTADKGHVELFERYRNGDLSERELIEFEARLVYDSELKEDFDNYEALEVGIKVHFRNELKSKFQGMDKLMDNPAKKRTDPRRCLIWSSAIAACLLIGVFLFQHFSSSKNAVLAKEYWPEEPGLPVKMSSKGKYDDAMNAYKLGEFDKAIKEFRKIELDTSSYFIGEIYYKKEYYKKAIYYFDTTPNGSTYSELSLFKKALCYILLNEKEKASIILNSVSKSPSNQYSCLAKKLLKKL